MLQVMSFELKRCLKELNPTLAERLSIGAIYCILTTVSVLLNVLLVHLIIAENLRTRNYVIYKLTISLCGSSIIYLSCNYPAMLVCTFSECSSFYPDTAIIAISALNTLGYYTSFWTNLQIALERISLFLFKTVHETIERCIYYFIGVSWLFGITVTACTLSVGCYKRYNTYTLTYSFGCSNCEINNVSLTEVLFWFSQFLSLLMFIGYATIIVKFKYILRHNNRSNAYKEFRLVFQFLVICTFQWFSCFFFYMVPVVFKTTIMGSLAMNISGIGNTVVNPIIILVFNKTINNGLYRLFGFSKATINAEVMISVMKRIQPLSLNDPKSQNEDGSVSTIVKTYKPTEQ